jgi:hypothetical protein
MCTHVYAGEKRPEISTAERALAMLEVQNVMSKHSYYHAANKHRAEIEDIWVKTDGKYADSATFTNPYFIMKGMDIIIENYVEDDYQRQLKSLEDISKKHPEIKNVKENIGAGYEWALHAQTTPVIEIAGDGKTAKGIWYSPGVGLGTGTYSRINNGSAHVSGILFYEKYGVDFVKEDGEWKIWHIQMYYDFTPMMGADWTSYENYEDIEMPVPEGCSPNPISYRPWSPTRVPSIQPAFPEKYYTFEETFSY